MSDKIRTCFKTSDDEVHDTIEAAEAHQMELDVDNWLHTVLNASHGDISSSKFIIGVIKGHNKKRKQEFIDILKNYGFLDENGKV